MIVSTIDKAFFVVFVMVNTFLSFINFAFRYINAQESVFIAGFLKKFEKIFKPPIIFNQRLGLFKATLFDYFFNNPQSAFTVGKIEVEAFEFFVLFPVKGGKKRLRGVLDARRDRTRDIVGIIKVKVTAFPVFFQVIGEKDGLFVKQGKVHADGRIIGNQRIAHDDKLSHVRIFRNINRAV